MIVTIIVPTGEVRQARAGEYYQLEDNTWTIPTSWTVGKYPIGIAHEVEVPEGSIGINIQPYNKVECWTTNIPLPRPKVKKWQWVVLESLKGTHLYTMPRTQDEIKERFPNAYWYHKISETEIEVSDE
jgi:hypothetical protein